MISEALQAKLDSLPSSPGVYLFKGATGKTIYIGKAKSLRNRVRSYFRRQRLSDQKTDVLRTYIRDLDYILTDSDVEALMLESNLVKKQQPLFNVNLKDDKSFLHIKLTVNEEFPRVLLTRRILKDGAVYFGPYLPASLARNTIKIINRHFLLRTCDIEIDGELERPCLEHDIKRCLGPCVAGLCSREEYGRAVGDVIQLLEGKNTPLVKSLRRRMLEAAKKENFEAAAFYRDRMRLVKDLAEQQKMILSGVGDVDIFAYHREGSRVALQLFTLRHGRVVGKREFFWEDLPFFDPPVFLRDALQQYYLNAGFVPASIYLPVEIEDQGLVQEWLTRKHRSRRGRKVRIHVPRRGDKLDLVLLVERNAAISFHTRFRILETSRSAVLEGLQKELDLPTVPKRIEAFDVSNIQGSETVASLVVSVDGKMSRKEYRRYKIKLVDGPDDYASICEAVRRRYRRVLAEETALPDFILIDGGPGQLHFAYQALAELGIEDIPVAGIAKKEELIHVMGQEAPLRLEGSSRTLRLLQEIRDEAHRFAVTYHRKRRSLRDFHSVLDEIPGIGQKRKKRLLRSFGSLAGIRRASERELVPFLGAKLARLVRERLDEVQERWTRFKNDRLRSCRKVRRPQSRPRQRSAGG